MTFELALRSTEVLLAMAIVQSSSEHLFGTQAERWLFGLRIPLACLLIAGIAIPWVLLSLAGLTLAVLHYFDGPYNGGSDRMTTLILCCLTAAHVMPSPVTQELFIGYLAVQVVLSYFVSGVVKLTNPDWRRGYALSDVFAFSAYPVSEATRNLATNAKLTWMASWGVIAFELAFPLALIDQQVLITALVAAFGFHIANALLFGLNRFVWAWLASYPSLLWLQDRTFGVGW